MFEGVIGSAEIVMIVGIPLLIYLVYKIIEAIAAFLKAANS